MKKPDWKENFPPHSHIATFGPPIRPGRTGRAIYENVTVHLQITKKETDTLFHAVVIGFEPPTATKPDLQVTDEVLVGIQHFLPD